MARETGPNYSLTDRGEAITLTPWFSGGTMTNRSVLLAGLGHCNFAEPARPRQLKQVVGDHTVAERRRHNDGRPEYRFASRHAQADGLSAWLLGQLYQRPRQ